MKLGFIVLAHRDPEQLSLLLSALRHRRVQIYLHVDRNVSLSPFLAELARSGLDDVVLLTRRNTVWGGLELVDVALEGLERSVAEQCNYSVLISGQDLPLRPIEDLLSFFADSRPRSFLEYWTLPTERWRLGGRDRTDYYTFTVRGRRETCIPRGEDLSGLSFKGRLLNQALRVRSRAFPARVHPAYVRPIGGVQWWALSREAANYVLAFVASHPDYREYHRYTSIPDELFFQSILAGTSFPDQHPLVNNSLHFTRWAPGDSHPRVLIRQDLPDMLASGKLFARKFDTSVDSEVIDDLIAGLVK